MNNNQKNIEKYEKIYQKLENILEFNYLDKDCMNYIEALNEIFSNITQKDKTQKIIRKIYKAIETEARKTIYFKDETINLIALTAGEMYEKDLTKYITQEDRKKIAITEFIKRKTEENNEKICKPETLCIKNEYKQINNVIKNLDNDENLDIINNAIITRFKSSNFNLEKYIENGVSLIIQLLDEGRYLENELEYIEVEIKQIKGNKDLKENETEELIKDKEQAKVIINEINNFNVINEIKKKAIENILKNIDYENTILNLDKKYVQYITEKIYYTEKDNITKEEIIDYLNNNKSLKIIKDKFPGDSFYYYIMNTNYYKHAQKNYMYNYNNYSFSDYEKEKKYEQIVNTYTPYSLYKENKNQISKKYKHKK